MWAPGWYSILTRLDYPCILLNYRTPDVIYDFFAEIIRPKDGEGKRMRQNNSGRAITGTIIVYP